MKLRVLVIASAIVVLGGCFDLSGSSNQICGLPSVEAPPEPPVDACRDGTVVFGPERIERDRGNPTRATHAFTTAGEAHACVTITSSGSDRQRVSSGTIDLDGDRIAGPNLFSQQVVTIERRLALAAGDHELETVLRGPPDTWVDVTVRIGGDGTRHGLVTSDHLELFNLYADPQTFHGDIDPTRLTAQGTALRLPGLPSGNTFVIRWRFQIVSVASCLPVRTLPGETVLGSVATFAPEAYWDGLDDAGAEVPEGTYAYRLIADLVRVGPGGDRVIDSLATALQTIELDRIEGVVDFHTHPLSHLGFGEKAMVGAPDLGLIVPANMATCGPEIRASTIAEALGNCNGAHGGWGLFDNGCGDHLRAALINLAVDPNFVHGGDFDHPHAGYPDFPHWPHQSSILHQQMWWEWLKRANDGGMRVVVALTVNNELLAEILNGNTPYDDRRVAERQIAETILMVEQHAEFMEIARSSDDLLRITGEGKLAVILGMEVDRIGNWDTGDAPGEAAIRAEIQHLHGLGIRYVFPVHLVDNAFGGTAVYDPMFSFANKRANGYHFEVETSSDPDVTYDASQWGDFPIAPGLTVIGLHALLEGLGHLPAPCYRFDDLTCLPPIGQLHCCGSYDSIVDALAPSPELFEYGGIDPGHMNSRGLTSRGEIAIDEMMRLGMIIDVDHMGEKTMERTIELAEATEQIAGAGYPLVFGHSGIRGRHCDVESTNCTERMPPVRLLTRVAALGGMAGAGSSSSTPAGFIEGYLGLQAIMGADSVGIGTDVNGFEPLPRRASCSDPFNYDDFFDAMPAVDGLATIEGSDREWDYVDDCGVTHYGLMPEWLFDIKVNHADDGAQVYQSIMRSTVGLIRMWQKIEAVSGQLQ